MGATSETNETDDENFSDDKVAQDYIKMCDDFYNSDQWSWLVMQELARDDPHRAYSILLKIVNCGVTKVIGHVGAGALRDILNENGKCVKDRFLTDVFVNPNLMRAFAAAGRFGNYTGDVDFDEKLHKIFAENELIDIRD